MENCVKNNADVIDFLHSNVSQASHLAYIAELNLKFSSRFLRHNVPAEWRIV